MVALDKLRQIALALPEVEERPSHGIPTFRVRGKIFASVRQELNSVALRVGFEARDSLIEADPGVFYFTDHYENYPMVLARLGKIRVAVLRDLLEEAWRGVAPKKLAKDYDAA